MFLRYENACFLPPKYIYMCYIVLRSVYMHPIVYTIVCAPVGGLLFHLLVIFMLYVSYTVWSCMCVCVLQCIRAFIYQPYSEKRCILPRKFLNSHLFICFLIAFGFARCHWVEITFVKYFIISQSNIIIIEKKDR